MTQWTTQIRSAAQWLQKRQPLCKYQIWPHTPAPHPPTHTDKTNTTLTLQDSSLNSSNSGTLSTEQGSVSTPAVGDTTLPKQGSTIHTTDTGTLAKQGSTTHTTDTGTLAKQGSTTHTTDTGTLPKQSPALRESDVLRETCTMVGNSLGAINSTFQDLYMHTNHSTPMQQQQYHTYANTYTPTPPPPPPPLHKKNWLEGLLHCLLSSSLMVCSEDMNAIRGQLGLPVSSCIFIF